MKRTAFVLFSIFLNLWASSQDLYDDLSQMKSTTLSNGMHIIAVKTGKFGETLTTLFVDVKPYRETISGELKFLSLLTGFSQENYFLLYKNIISTPQALDSVFGFLQSRISKPSFTPQMVNRAKKTQLKFLADSSYEKTLSRLYLGKYNIFARPIQPADIQSIDINFLNSLFPKIFQPKKMFLIVSGYVEPDTVFALANKYFSKNKNFPFAQQPYTPKNFVSKPEINYVKINNFSSLTFATPLFIPPKSNLFPYFFLSKKLLETELIPELSEDTAMFKLSEFDFSWGIYQGKFSLFFKSKDDYVYNAVLNMREKFANLNNFPQETFDKIKHQTLKDFDTYLQSQSTFNFYAFLIKKFGLPKDFYSRLHKKIENTTYSDFKQNFTKVFNPDSIKIIITGDENHIICQLYYLAYFQRVVQYDENFYKYSIIAKGFGSKTIIEDYLKSVNASKSIRNLILFFDATYIFPEKDEKFTLKGLILKKYPDFYRYKTIFVVGKDTLLHNLQIANGKQWIDSSSLGCQTLSRKEFYARIYKAYIFPELYYDSLGFKTTLMCDSTNLKKHIFKIRVSTPYDIVYYDYYDMNRKIKLRTEIYIKDGGGEKLSEVIEYSDYKPIDKNSDIKMPFTIREITQSYNLILKITSVDVKTKISKNYFKLPQKTN